MNIIKTVNALLFLILTSSSSFANEFKILDYYAGINTDKLPCKMELVKNWLTSDQYMCAFKKSKHDIIEFQSDYISQKAYQIDRYILLNVSDALKITVQLLSKYGQPYSSYQDESFGTELPIMTWRDSKKQGVSLSLNFLKCSGSSFGKCRALFGVTKNSPDKALLNLTIFDNKRHHYSKIVMKTGKRPKPVKVNTLNIQETQDITDLEF